MKALLLAAALGFMTAVAMTAVLRGVSERARFSFLVGLFGVGLVCLVAVHIGSPPDLWILPPDMLATPSACDLAFAIFLYVSGFWGGLLQLYNLAERGLSLRILIDVLDAPPRTLSVADIAKGYSAGRGLAWMYGKRLNDMISLGLVERQGGQIAITGKGLRLARNIGRARALLGLGQREVATGKA